MKKFYCISQKIIGRDKAESLIFSNESARNQYYQSHNLCSKFFKNFDINFLKENDTLIFETAEQAENYMRYAYGNDEII